MFGRRAFVGLAAAFGALVLAGTIPSKTLQGSDESAGERGARRDDPSGRAEWNAMLRRDPQGRVLSENRLKALNQACDMPVDPSMALPPAGTFSRSDVGPSIPASATFSGTAWQSLGPHPMQSYTAYPPRQYGNVGGRVDAIAIHPTNPSIILLGSATGGIWKSTDGGQTWRPVSDYAPALAISHVTFSPANPSIVFAATGEADNALYDHSLSGSLGTYLGGGLLKSTDSGETWFRVDTNLPANAIISRVIPHPLDAQRVVVGIIRIPNPSTDAFNVGGAYRSTDGGVTFSLTLAHRVTDLLQDSNEPNRLYLATGNCSSCGKKGVYLSADFGLTWFPNFTYEQAGPTIGNTKLGVSRTNPAVLYASFIDGDDAHIGIYRSSDGATSWTTQNFESSMCPTKASGDTNQCSYDHFIAPDPFNPSTVYFGSISFYKSTDSGMTWVKKVDVYTDVGVARLHPDQHTGVFSASGALLIGNDGGVYRTSDGGNNFENLNSTLNVSQFQTLALHPTNREFAMGGTQDNGGQRYTGSLSWSDRIGGDGGFALIRKDSPTQVLAAHYWASLEYSADGGSVFADRTDCVSLMNCVTGDPGETMGFYIPATAAPAAPSTVLIGTNRVWSNSTFGSDRTKWQPLKPSALTTASGDYLTALEASIDLIGIWAGSRLGYVYFSPPGDDAFYSVGEVLPSAPVTKILSVSADGWTAYVSFGGYLGTPSKHVFRTVNGGTTWTNISSNLPDVPVLTMALDPTDPTDIFIGTDVGVFRSVNGGASWVTFNQGLPNVPVYDLKFQASSADLWAATYGRGVWRISNPIPPQTPISNFTITPVSPVAGQALLFIDTSTGAPTSWSWNFGDGGTSNAQYPTHTYSAAGTKTVTLTASNSAGQNTASKPVTVAAGGGTGCAANATTLCLIGGRYRVTSYWKNQYADGAISTLYRATLTNTTGAFWLNDSNTYEYLIRINTATDNGRAWIAIPTFTDVEFFVLVEDLVKGQSKTYHSLPGNKTLIYDPFFFIYP
jgi:photosystem II stability/assembly factor-like uncharacterized protein